MESGFRPTVHWLKIATALGFPLANFESWAASYDPPQRGLVGETGPSPASRANPFKHQVEARTPQAMGSAFECFLSEGFESR